MIGLLSVVSVVAGAAAAYYADRFPAYIETIETGAGALFLGGLALIGAALPGIVA